MPYFAVLFTAIVLVLIRFGILPIVLGAFVYDLLFTFCVTTDFSVCYAGNTFFVVGVILALTAYGFRTGLGGRPLFKQSILD